MKTIDKIKYLKLVKKITKNKKVADEVGDLIIESFKQKKIKEKDQAINLAYILVRLSLKMDTKIEVREVMDCYNFTLDFLLNKIKEDNLKQI